MMLLTLTQRCANILVAVREEIRLAGDEVSDVLREPITKLAEYVISVAMLDQPHLLNADRSL